MSSATFVASVEWTATVSPSKRPRARLDDLQMRSGHARDGLWCKDQAVGASLVDEMQRVDQDGGDRVFHRVGQH